MEGDEPAAASCLRLPTSACAGSQAYHGLVPVRTTRRSRGRGLPGLGRTRAVRL